MAKFTVSEDTFISDSWIITIQPCKQYGTISTKETRLGPHSRKSPRFAWWTKRFYSSVCTEKKLSMRHINTHVQLENGHECKCRTIPNGATRDQRHSRFQAVSCILIYDLSASFRWILVSSGFIVVKSWKHSPAVACSIEVLVLLSPQRVRASRQRQSIDV